MTQYPKSIQRAIAALSKLPGIGSKTAERLVIFITRLKKTDREEFSSAITSLSSASVLCSSCGYLAEEGKTLCSYCSDPRRDTELFCVVSDIQNVPSIEKTNAFRGLYHVLGGTINPLEGISADDLSIAALLARIKKAKRVKEIIIATGTDIEGEHTALYLAKVLKPLSVPLTRLARGIPRGSNLEYTDELTLADALKERRTLS